jgi:unspecific monooxygenase
MLGVPTDRGRDLLDWSHAMVKMYELDTTLDQAERAAQAAAEFTEYVQSLIEQRRGEPQDDMVTRLAEVESEGERLTDAQIVSTMIVLLNAGHEATVNTLGNGVLALLRHPEQLRRLVEGEVEPPQAVEELIRWDPPLQLFERWVLEDGVELAGRPLPRGAKVAVLFGAANRDPRRFDDPDAFDVGRANAADHVGFGGGIHVCIGAPLARIELAAALGALVERAPGLSLVEEPRRNRAFVIWGLEALEVAA